MCHCQNCFKQIEYGKFCGECREEFRRVEFSQEARAIRLLNAAKANSCRHVAHRFSGTQQYSRFSYGADAGHGE
jgi:hypothetical protein